MITMTTQVDDEAFAAVERKSSVVFVDGKPVLPDNKTGGRAVNFLLLFSCFAFGCSQFLFGFDNSVISPIVALQPFVRYLYRQALGLKLAATAT